MSLTDRDRLIKMIEDGFPTNIAILFGKNIEKIADYLLANGVIVLPCKVGDMIYIIDLFDYEPCKKSGKDGGVCPHLYAEYGVGYECRKGYYGEKPFSCAEIKTEKIEDICQIFSYWTWFGKTVFLTKEEAEEKLKELNK